MSFAVKSLQCVDCKKDFIFSIEEQQLHASHGFVNAPGRCPPCRQTKKSGRIQNEDASEDYNTRRPMFAVTCAQCGKATRVPFQPRQDKSVYCSDCYIKSRVGK
jgi:CxxC-x17-CxxC domain-containing protein